MCEDGLGGGWQQRARVISNSEGGLRSVSTMQAVSGLGLAHKAHGFSRIRRARMVRRQQPPHPDVHCQPQAAQHVVEGRRLVGVGLKQNEVGARTVEAL